MAETATTFTGKLGGKLRRMARDGFTLHELLYPINRSPARHAVKGLVNLAHWRSKQARRAVARDLTPHGDLDAPLASLQSEGHADLTGLVDAEALAALGQGADALLTQSAAIEGQQLQDNKRYWLRLLDAEIAAGRLNEQSPFVRFALQPRIVELVTRYFSEVPLMTYVLLSQSRGEDADYRVSQLWHKDHDDVRVLKLFAYLSDVPDADYGPFTFLPKPASARITGGLAAHRTDAEVSDRLAPDSARTMTAPAGSVFMVDTSQCYHMGSRMAPGRTRLLFTACFITAPPMFPNFDNRIRITGPVTDLERLVLRV